MKIIKRNSWRRISQSKIRNSAAAKARAGREFLSPLPPFLPAPPERRFCATRSTAINFVQNRFGFGCIIAPEFDFQEFCRQIQRRFAPLYTETLARRARRGSPIRGSIFLAILSICFAQ